MRTPVLLALALAVAACKQSPPGKCSGNEGCGVGQECAGGVCVRFDTDHQLGSRCIRDGDCVAWGRCAGETCTLAPGHCLDGGGCPSWQRCSFETFTCETAVGFCAGPAECQGWQTCGADHLCATASGRCGGPGDCAAWETCSASHACVLSAGRCYSTPQCGPTLICDANHECIHPVLQSDVLMIGDVGRAWGLAPVDRPADVQVALPNPIWMGYVDPSGAVVYSADLSGFIGLRRFVPDPVDTYSIDAPANDPVVLTSTTWCPNLLAPRWVMQAETGARLVHCAVGASADWRFTDETGALRVSPWLALAWTADDYFLARSNGGPSGLPDAIIDPAGAWTAIRGIPAGGAIVAVRVHPSGFRVYVRNYADNLDESYLVARDGAATLEGTYADLPPNANPSGSHPHIALDANGTLYQQDTAQVFKRPLKPGTCSIIQPSAMFVGWLQGFITPP